MELLWIILGGAFGALIKVIFDGEHKLATPVFTKGYFYLGFIGNMIIGAASAIIGVSFFISSVSSGSIEGMDPLKLFATSIAFGIAYNSVIEGVIEKVKTGKSGKSA